jgi:16S rRNA processing protein RimM
MPDSKSKASDSNAPAQSQPAARRRPPRRKPTPAPTTSTPHPTSTTERATTERAPARAARQPRTPSSRPLAQTPGPDPETPLDDVRLTVGTIAGTHGVAGEVTMRLTTDDPDHLRRIKQVFVGDEAQPRRLIGLRFHAGMALLRLGGVRTREEGRLLLGQPVRIAGTDARPLEPGEFYYYQAIGLEALDEAGHRIGTVTDILETGANDVFVITPDEGADILLPNIPEVILDLNPAERRMVVRPLVYYGDE